MDPTDRLRATLDSLLDPHVVLTAVRDEAGEIVDFEYTDANAAACDYNGMTHAELMGRRLLDLFPGHAKVGLLDAYKKVIATGEPLVLDDIVYRVERRGGAALRFDVRAVAVGDDMVYTWRDVTERHEHLAALQQAEREYRSLAEATTDMAYRTDARGSIVWVSPSVTRVLGWLPEEFVGRSIAEFAAPEEFSRFSGQRARIYAGEQLPEADSAAVFHLAAKDGPRVPMSAIVARDYDAEGAWTGGLLVGLRDVSQVLREQRIAQDERMRAARIQLSMDAAAIGMAVASVDGVFQYVNPALARMLGCGQEDLVGMTVADVTHPDDRDASEAMLQRLMTGEVDHLNVRKRYLTVSGEVLWVDLAVGVARTEDAAIDHFIAQMIDVTPEVDYAEALERTVRRFRLLAENASDVVYELDGDGRIVWASPSVQNVLGWSPESLSKTLGTDLMAGGQDQLLGLRRERIEQGFSVSGQEIRYRTAAGGTKWMSSLAHPIATGEGAVTGAVVGLRDISAEVAAREALAQTQRRLRLAVDAAPDGLAITDADEVLIDVNREFCRLLGRQEAEVVGRGLGQVLSTMSSDPCVPDSRHEHEISTDTGSRWVAHAVGRVTGPEDPVAFHVHLLSDVTRSRQMREELAHQATHDVLTGVANRRRVLDRFQTLVDAGAAVRGAGGVGVVFCDVDGLKAVNDTLGHAAGDRVLTEVAGRLAGALRSDDEVGRVGGDEFVVLLHRLSSESDLRAVAEKLRAKVAGTIEVDGVPVALAASYGAALVTSDEDIRSALDRADDALYRAKAAGRNRVVVAEGPPDRD